MRSLERTCTIDNVTYQVYLFPLQLAINNFDLLQKVYGEALISLITSALNFSVLSEGKVEFNIEEDTIKTALSSYQKSLNVGDTFKVLKSLLDPSHIKSKDGGIVIDQAYDKYGFKHLLTLAVFVITENYADFLSFGRQSPNASPPSNQRTPEKPPQTF